MFGFARSDARVSSAISASPKVRALTLLIAITLASVRSSSFVSRHEAIESVTTKVRHATRSETITVTMTMTTSFRSIGESWIQRSSKCGLSGRG